MARLIGILVGAVFALALIVAALMPREAAQETASHRLHLEPHESHLASDGMLGHFDRQQVQRGFQVYKEVCAACHSLRLVAFRDLQDLGFTAPEVKAIANQWNTEQPSINPDTGEAATRKNLPSDHFPSPFANETAARAANNNALPPDLSLMTKAREGSHEYIRSLLTGYRPQTAAELKAFPDIKTPSGLHYNPYFANLNIAMPPPLTADGQVEYADKTKATIDQMATDVSAFLVWTAEPRLEARHRYGLTILIFLLIATTLAYLSYRNIWAGTKH